MQSFEFTNSVKVVLLAIISRIEEEEERRTRTREEAEWKHILVLTRGTLLSDFINSRWFFTTKSFPHYSRI